MKNDLNPHDTLPEGQHHGPNGSKPQNGRVGDEVGPVASSMVRPPLLRATKSLTRSPPAISAIWKPRTNAQAVPNRRTPRVTLRRAKCRCS